MSERVWVNPLVWLPEIEQGKKIEGREKGGGWRPNPIARYDAMHAIAMIKCNGGLLLWPDTMQTLNQLNRSPDGLIFLQMFQTLYGQTAAALYAKAAGQNAQARQLYNASADTYYKANDAAAYDDWVRARNHWDYFYNRS
eukprot:768592-Hanusia_phi.AAC.3